MIALAIYASRTAPSGTLELDPTIVSHESGHAYVVQLVSPKPYLYRIADDSQSHPRRSGLELTEDGQRLGPAHAAHDQIRSAGAGHYSHWLGWLRFSASDNTDPRTNGRSYRVHFQAEPLLPAVPVVIAASVVAVFSVVGLVTPVDALRRHGRLAVRRLPGVLGVIAVNLLLLGLMVLVLEVGARLYFYGTLTLHDVELGFMTAHPTRGWSLSPNSVQHWQNLDYSVISRTNSRGFRDRERSLEKPAGTRRVVVLGDSFMEGYYVDFEQSFAVLLEKRLAGANVEVINLGVRGYGTTQAHLTLKEEGVLYQPDLVLLFFAMNNDLSNDSKVWRDALLLKPVDPDVLPPFLSVLSEGRVEYEYPDYERNKAAITAMGRLVENQRKSRPAWQRAVLYRLFLHVVELLDGASTRDLGERPTVVLPYDPNVTYGEVVRSFDPALAGHRFSAAEYAEKLDGAWRVTCRSLGLAQEIASSAGSAFAVVTVPSMIQVDPVYQEKFRAAYPSLELKPQASSERLALCAKDQGFAVLDLLPAFIDAAQGDGAVLYHQYADRHWNPRGVELAVEVVHRLLKEHGFLGSGNVLGGH